MSLPLVVSWGGGVNSTAMLIGMMERGIRPNWILFADTGGEKPETYEFRTRLGSWLFKAGFPPIATVYNDGMYGQLETECLEKHTLPSIAFGFKSCSDKYKRRPQEKALRLYFPNGEQIRMAIGFDAGESRRATYTETQRYQYWFPLIEWGWDREKCIEAIGRAGLPVPVKSACFFCPSSKKAEVLALAKEHPDLFARATAMERNANLTTIKGLGRSYSWDQLVADKTLKAIEQPSLPCMCFDGEED
jgi:hypothetical protein